MMVVEEKGVTKSEFLQSSAAELNIMMGTIWKIATQGRHITGVGGLELEHHQFHLSWI